MPKIDEATKQQRLERIHLLLTRHPLGLTESELAEETSLERRTVNNYLRELEDQGKAIKDGIYWTPLSLKEGRLRPFDLSPEEAVTLYLGARLLAKQQDKRNEPAETALLKLASVLKADAGVGNEIEQAARELAGRPVQEGYQPVFRDVVRGYIYRKKIELTYRPLNWKRSFTTTFSTYLLEPSPIGFSTYLIGHSSIVNALRAYKLERIEAARLTREDYAIPLDFPGLEILRNAWSIVAGDETVRVVLRFSPQVRARVLETRWHPSQATLDDPDKPGWLRWQVDVADTLDLLPWVRAWGADCEVLGPDGMREALEKDVRKMVRVYGVEKPENIPAYFHSWAKAEKEQTPDVHPLIYHLLDVGECALALWSYALSEQTRQALSQALGLDIPSTGRLLAFWAALHDLGKAAPGFQRKYEPRIHILEKAGFTFPTQTEMNATPAPHGIVSAWALTGLLASETGLPPRLAASIAHALGGHHGTWPTPNHLKHPALQPSDKGNETWDSARREIFLALKAIYQPTSAASLPKNLEESNAFLTLFTGLASVADWIGSMEEHFPFTDDCMPPAEYAQRHAARQAHTALEKLGWLGWQADGNRLTFAAMFPETPHPRPIQQQTFEAALESELPALAILEAPTGIGKTETALYLADAWLQRQKGSGLYLAMPTQATSNQMYDRTVKFLCSRYPEQTINIHLIHGGALLAKENSQPQGIAQDTPAAEAGVRAASWFLPRKRTLLAPFGVGTVDQALMSVLQTRHFFVRLFGLGQKVIVFDEIHAYDTYMSELFQRLLRWLRSIGTSVILLSATLPEKTRRELVAAWLGKDDDEDFALPPAAYPRLTLAGGAQVASVPLPPPPSRVLRLEWVDPASGQIASILAEKLEAGGCAVVICNRVKRAQEVYTALQEVIEPENLILFHARFPFQWREEIEKRVLKKFGKNKDHPNQPNPDRPPRAIVVATQVIEQSLDLDFDYMISDLAPVDLLLQRAGRLHRHPQNDANRPASLDQPVMAIALPTEKEGQPDFGLDTRIYDAVTLLRTWLALQGRQQITLPQETATLIEQVYPQKPNDDQFDPAYRTILKDTAQKARLKHEKEMAEAISRRIPDPTYEGLLINPNDNLEEDDPRAGQAFRALTRLGDPSISLICLHRTPQGIALEPDRTDTLPDISHCPTFDQAKELLRRAVSVQRKDVVNYIVNHDSRTTEWRKSAAVREHYPIIFEPNGEYHPEGAEFFLRLSRELGLEVVSSEAT